MGYARRTDANQAEIVKVFRSMGCSVAVTSMVSNGFPDLIIARNGVNILIEVKDGSKNPSARKLTDDEADFHEKWKGSIYIVESIDDAIKVVNSLRDQVHI